MLVLNVDNVNGKLRVKREQDGVLGTAHTTHLLLQHWIVQLHLT